MSSASMLVYGESRSLVRSDQHRRVLAKNDTGVVGWYAKAFSITPSAKLTLPVTAVPPLSAAISMASMTSFDDAPENCFLDEV
jgi:hypothetical protein